MSATLPFLSLLNFSIHFLACIDAWGGITQQRCKKHIVYFYEEKWENMILSNQKQYTFQEGKHCQSNKQY